MVTVNVIKRLAASPTVFDDAIKKINEATAAYTATIGDLGARLNVEILRQGGQLRDDINKLSNQIESEFDTVKQSVKDIKGNIQSIDFGFGFNACLWVAAHDYMRETDQQDVFQWLSPSYWEAKSQLQAVTNQRHKDTLSWLLELPEIERWQNSHPGSHERFLWIKGYPEAGESVME